MQPILSYVHGDDQIRLFNDEGYFLILHTAHQAIIKSDRYLNETQAYIVYHRWIMESAMCYVPKIGELPIEEFMERCLQA